MIKVHFRIPTHGNDKKRFSVQRHRAFERMLDNLFDGYSGPSAVMAGSWRDKDGTVYRDRNVTYFVLVDGLLAASPRILEAVEFAKSNFEQKSIAVEYLEHGEIL